MPRIVTDPALIAELEKAQSAPNMVGQELGQAAGAAGRVVSDPGLIAELEKLASTQAQPQPEAPGWFGRQWQGLKDAAGAVSDAYHGKQDPNFEAVKTFTGEGLAGDSQDRLFKGGMTSASVDDKAWNDIVKTTIGDKLKGVETDANGNEVITYQGDDGKPYRTYLNKPGLDVMDVTRGLTGAVPYLLSGGIAGKATKGMNLLARAPAQFVAGAGTSLASDKAAQALGSEQPADLGRAGMAGAFGAGGEAAIAALSPVVKRLFTPQYFDDATGTLTKSGVNEAKKLGLDPAEVQQHLTDSLARGEKPALGNVFSAENPGEAMAQVKTGEFGIPTTAGQRSKDPAQLQVEEEMRRSLWGQGARDVMNDFDALQKTRIAEGADSVRKTMAPTSAGTRNEAGEATVSALMSAKGKMRAAERQAWDAVPPIYPAATATDSLPGIMQQRFATLGFLPDEQLTPAAHRQMTMLTDYLAGKELQQPYKLLGETTGRPALDDMRRRLLGLYKAAQPGQDQAASKAVYESFNDWIDDIGQKGLILDKPASQGGAQLAADVADKLGIARTFTKEQRALFGQRGRGDAAGKLLENLSRDADTPERIVNSLFGQGANAAPKAGAVGALKRLQTIFKQNSPDAWDQVKAAYWVNITRGKNGEMLTPGRLKESIAKAFENQKSIVDTLFTPQEQDLMRRFQKGVDDATFTPPNPSGTSYALQGMKKGERDNVLAYLLRRMGQSATFQGKPLKSAVLQSLARKVPDIGGTGEMLRRSMAERAVGQAVKQKKNTSNLARALLQQYGTSENAP